MLAAEITRRYSKDDILELYLNEIYYGNLAYGVEAASRNIFWEDRQSIRLGKGIVPGRFAAISVCYDIYTNHDVTLARQQQVLVLTFGVSQSKGCIKVSNSETPICVVHPLRRVRPMK